MSDSPTAVPSSHVEIYAQTLRHLFRPIVPFLDDPTVSEVLINAPDVVYVERAGRLHRTEATFSGPAALMAAARNLAEYVGRPIDGGQHSVDGRLPDGSRVHVLFPPASRQGVCVSIRKFQREVFDLDSLVARNTMTAAAAEFLCIAVRARKNIVVAGGTGTGKTSLLNALSTAIPADERVVVIEDSSELQLRQPHTLYLESQPEQPGGRAAVTIRDLFVDSLRMRPDRILVGEVRRGEALDLIQSMLSGHTGSLTTVHASTPRDAAVRLETLCLMSDVGLPQPVARTQVASAVNLVVQLNRFPDGRRRVVKVSEVVGLTGPAGDYSVCDLFTYRAAAGGGDGTLVPTGASPTFTAEVFDAGLDGMMKETLGLFTRPPSSTAGG